MIIRNRYSGEVYSDLKETGINEVQSLVENGKKSSVEMAQIPVFELSDYLYSISDNIQKSSHELSITISSETGKPLRQSRNEVKKASRTFLLAAEEMKSLEGTTHDGRRQKSLQDHLAFTSSVPVGTILSIHPFTEPLYSVSSRVAASLATGNSIVVKPSSQSPVSTLKLLEIIGKVGLPDHSVQAALTHRNSKATKALITSDSFGLTTFSGRTDSLPEIIKHTGLRRTLIETGSSSPAIVWDDADLDGAAESIVNSSFSFQGQAPVRTQVVIVKRDSYEYFKNRLIELSQQLKPGDPLEEDTDYGPLMNEEAAKKAEELVNKALENAGYLVSGAIREGSFFEPTIIENVALSSDLVRKQILAPVMTIHQVDSFNEALQLANETGVSSQTGIFTSDINLAMTAIEKLNCGTISVNDAPGLPVENISSSNPKGNLTASKSMRYLMRNMVEEKLALLRR